MFNVCHVCECVCRHDTADTMIHILINILLQLTYSTRQKKVHVLYKRNVYETNCIGFVSVAFVY